MQSSKLNQLDEKDKNKVTYQVINADEKSFKLNLNKPLSFYLEMVVTTIIKRSLSDFRLKMMIKFLSAAMLNFLKSLDLKEH